MKEWITIKMYFDLYHSKEKVWAKTYVLHVKGFVITRIHSHFKAAKKQKRTAAYSFKLFLFK